MSFHKDRNELRACFFLIVFVDILFSKKAEYLKRRRVVKYFKNYCTPVTSSSS